MNSSIVAFGYVHYCKSVCQSKLKNRMANSVDPDETARHEPFYLDLHCLQMCLSIYKAERVKL